MPRLFVLSSLLSGAGVCLLALGSICGKLVDVVVADRHILYITENHDIHASRVPQPPYAASHLKGFVVCLLLHTSSGFSDVVMRNGSGSASS